VRAPFPRKSPGMLREEIQAADLIIVVITPFSIASSYVLFELGASWGLNKPTFPLLARAAKYKDLPGPLQERNAPSLHKEAEILDDAGLNGNFKARSGIADKLKVRISELARNAAKSI